MRRVSVSLALIFSLIVGYSFKGQAANRSYDRSFEDFRSEPPNLYSSEVDETGDACQFEPGDVLTVRDSYQLDVPAVGTPEYSELADKCPAIVLEGRFFPTSPKDYNHTILISEGGPWWKARFIHATHPEGVEEASLGDYTRGGMGPCRWKFTSATAYSRPKSYRFSGFEAVAKARKYLGESYALTPESFNEKTWLHFRDNPDSRVIDMLFLEGPKNILGILGEITWDASVLNISQLLYSQPRFCGLTKKSVEKCGKLRRCNVCEDPGKGSKFCSELIWWSYGGYLGRDVGGALPTGKDGGQVPGTFKYSKMYTTKGDDGLPRAFKLYYAAAHSTNDVKKNFTLKCTGTTIPSLKPLK